MNNSSQENAEALIPIDAGQNSDYSAGYSTGSLQGRRQINYPKTQRELWENNNIQFIDCSITNVPIYNKALMTTKGNKIS